MFLTSLFTDFLCQVSTIALYGAKPKKEKEKNVLEFSQKSIEIPANIGNVGDVKTEQLKLKLKMNNTKTEFIV